MQRQPHVLKEPSALTSFLDAGRFQVTSPFMILKLKCRQRAQANSSSLARKNEPTMQRSTTPMGPSVHKGWSRFVQRAIKITSSGKACLEGPLPRSIDRMQFFTSMANSSVQGETCEAIFSMCSAFARLA